jgi:cyclopropane-fatty-acyl-phospholipid synthase
MGLTAHATLSRMPAQISADFLDNLLAGYPKRDFQVRFWDGSTWGTGQQPRFILVLTHPGALREMFLSASELTLGEAYIFGDFEIQGDMAAALDLADYLLEHADRTLGQNLHLAGMLRKLPSRQQARAGRPAAALPGAVHSKERDRRAISYHYDVPPGFFALWLDRNMQYSSAYFTSREIDLDTAQDQKLDYICRKLRLGRGDRLLDIGCGWGGLLIHAAAHYDAQAVGITLSVPQAELARQRIRDSGLNDRCRVEVCDYRDLEADQQFDKIASVGMFEHVGEAWLQEYFTLTWRLLRPGGAFLNSGIAASSAYHRQGPSFIEHYVFPDGELVPLYISLCAAEKSGFEVRDVESLREHYALTLHDWLQRLEAHAEDARRVTDETTYRIWRLYIAASEHRFRSGQLNLYQVLLAKPADGKSGMPLTRADWYRL